MSGVERIAAERQRQIEAEGWTPEHDAEHTDGEMIRAAVAYARAGRRVAHYLAFAPNLFAEEMELLRREPLSGWPWHVDWWKPSDDPIRNLEKAGALIASEIDRLERSAPLHAPVGFDADGRPLDCIVDGEPWPCSASKGQP